MTQPEIIKLVITILLSSASTVYFTKLAERHWPAKSQTNSFFQKAAFVTLAYFLPMFSLYTLFTKSQTVDKTFIALALLFTSILIVNLVQHLLLLHFRQIHKALTGAMDRFLDATQPPPSAR